MTRLSTAPFLIPILICLLVGVFGGVLAGCQSHSGDFYTASNPQSMAGKSAASIEQSLGAALAAEKAAGQ